jgi:hypothetical protein
MLIGHAHVSTIEQSLDLQTDTLKRSGCEKLFTDWVPGASAEQPRLDQALARLRKADTLVVWRLNRPDRSIRHLVETVGRFQEGKVGFRSLQESIDTTTSSGNLTENETVARKPGGWWVFPGTRRLTFLGASPCGRRPQPPRLVGGFSRVAGVDDGVSRRAPRNAGLLASVPLLSL